MWLRLVRLPRQRRREQAAGRGGAARARRASRSRWRLTESRLSARIRRGACTAVTRAVRLWPGEDQAAENPSAPVRTALPALDGAGGVRAVARSDLPLARLRCTRREMPDRPHCPLPAGADASVE